MTLWKFRDGPVDIIHRVMDSILSVARENLIGNLILRIFSGEILIKLQGMLCHHRVEWWKFHGSSAKRRRIFLSNPLPPTPDSAPLVVPI